MVKKILFTIAVVTLLAVTVQAADPVFFAGAIKDDDMWPFEYIYVDLCTMPILIDVGYFVQVKDCGDRKIKLKQVPCESIGKGGKFPCYEDCESIEVRANFEAKLGANVSSSVSWFNAGNASAYYGDCGEGCVPDIVPGDGAWHTKKVCVRAWEVSIWNAGEAQGQNEARIGDLTITVKPTQG